MANQKPASPEVRVVKAQVQEQKLLQKMIDDRADSVSSVQESSQQLMAGLEGAERKTMQKEMSSLDTRWGNVTGNARDR